MKHREATIFGLIHYLISKIGIEKITHKTNNNRLDLINDLKKDCKLVLEKNISDYEKEYLNFMINYLNGCATNKDKKTNRFHLMDI